MALFSPGSGGVTEEPSSSDSPLHFQTCPLWRRSGRPGRAETVQAHVRPAWARGPSSAARGRDHEPTWTGLPGRALLTSSLAPH